MTEIALEQNILERLADPYVQALVRERAWASFMSESRGQVVELDAYRHALFDARLKVFRELIAEE